MQEEALDFSVKQANMRSSTSQSTPELSPILAPSSNALGPSYFSPVSLDEAHKQLLEQLSPFALLSSSGGIAVSGLAAQLPPMALMTNQLLPTTSLALTALQRRRRRISSGSADELATAKKLRSIPEDRKVKQVCPEDTVIW